MRREVNGTATSRLDSTTPLCTVCEQTEAYEDIFGVIMPKEDWAYARLCREYGVVEPT